MQLQGFILYNTDRVSPSLVSDGVAYFAVAQRQLMDGIAFLSLMSLLICEWASPAFLDSVVEELILMKMWKDERELSRSACLRGGIPGSLACFQTTYTIDLQINPRMMSTTEFDAYQNYK